MQERRISKQRYTQKQESEESDPEWLTDDMNGLDDNFNFETHKFPEPKAPKQAAKKEA